VTTVVATLEDGTDLIWSLSIDVEAIAEKLTQHLGEREGDP
jgi:hypothetical protein